MQSTLPAVLEPHRTYLDRANELTGPHPLVALQCRLMCLQLAMTERRDLPELAACELRQWITTTLDECEAARARLSATATDPVTALAALRALGLELIARANQRAVKVPQLTGSPGSWLRYALGTSRSTPHRMLW